ncbi:MAG TPA: hypothetical protein VJT84_07740 [Gaiellaceae bacterium]|nr:hypothetical protein [Gaiellaceae bacterium]
MTQGANLSGVLAWTSGRRLLVQSSGEIDRVTATTGKIDPIDSGSLPLFPLSPDHSQVAYAVFNPVPSLRVVRGAGGSWREVTSYPGDGASILQLVWRRDGARIAYSNDYAGGEVAWVEASGGEPHVAIPADGSTIRWVLGYLTDGTILVHETDRGGHNGRVLRVTEDGAITPIALDANQAAASANAETIAYASGQTIYAVSSAGGTPVPIVTVEGETYYLKLSPDGSKVAVSSTDFDTGEVFTHLAKTDGSGSVQLPYPARGAFDWSPNSKKLVFAGRNPANGGELGLATITWRAASLRALPDTPCIGPSFSTDAKRIACIKHEGDDIHGHDELAVIRIA